MTFICVFCDRGNPCGCPRLGRHEACPVPRYGDCPYAVMDSDQPSTVLAPVPQLIIVPCRLCHDGLQVFGEEIALLD